MGEDGANIVTRNSRLAFCVNGKFWVNNHAHVFKSKYSNYFLSEILESINYDKYNTGTAQPKLNAKVLRGIKIVMPEELEQKKIASFLSAVDSKIEKLTRKKELLEEYKKGVMQKLFSGEIRFKDENGDNYPDWGTLFFGNVFERVTRKNKENNNNIMTISAQDGLINQKKYFNHSVSAKDVSGYYQINKDEFAYNKSYSKGYPLGAIKRLTRYDKGVLSTLYICFRAKNYESVDYLEHYFDSQVINKELYRIAQEGARNHGLLNLSVVEFFKDIQIKLPIIEEQIKIASFLNQLNSKIMKESRLLDKTKKFKKGLLQQMFV